MVTIIHRLKRAFAYHRANVLVYLRRHNWSAKKLSLTGLAFVIICVVTLQKYEMQKERKMLPLESSEKPTFGMKFQLTNGIENQYVAMIRYAQTQKYDGDNIVSHRMNNYGLGSDLHTWAWTLCNSVKKQKILMVDPRWVWNKCDSKHSLNCFFNPHPNCSPKDRESHPAMNGDRNCTLGAEQSVLEYRNSAMEYLFSTIDESFLREVTKRKEEIFASGTPPNLISIHMRQSDKVNERSAPVDVGVSMYLAMVKYIADLVKIKDVAVFLITEDNEACIEFAEKAEKEGWKLYMWRPLDKSKVAHGSKTDYKPKHDKAETLNGELATQAITNALIALEARYFVLTRASNWSRVIDELRQSRFITHETKMWDLAPDKNYLDKGKSGFRPPAKHLSNRKK